VKLARVPATFGLRRGVDLAAGGVPAAHRAPHGQGTISPFRCYRSAARAKEGIVNGLIYLIGLIVVILFILSFLGLG
jgi:hypothetical protein